GREDAGEAERRRGGGGRALWTCRGEGRALHPVPYVVDGRHQGGQEPRGSQGPAIGRPGREPADPGVLWSVPAGPAAGRRRRGSDRQGAGRAGAEIGPPSVRQDEIGVRPEQGRTRALSTGWARRM